MPLAFPCLLFHKYHGTAAVHYIVCHAFDSGVKLYLDFFKPLNSLPQCLHGFREQAGEIYRWNIHQVPLNTTTFPGCRICSVAGWWKDKKYHERYLLHCCPGCFPLLLSLEQGTRWRGLWSKWSKGFCSLETCWAWFIWILSRLMGVWMA